MLLDQGKIVAVGTQADVEVPDDAELVDASGSWVLPGFIDAHVHLGVHEDGEGWSGNDTNEMTDPNGARFRAIDGIDPYEVGFDDALAGGVTSVVIKPGSGNPIGGETVGVKRPGTPVVDMLFADRIASKARSVRTPSGSTVRRTRPRPRGSGWPRCCGRLHRGARLRRRREHARAEGKPFEVDLALETLSRVLDGELYPGPAHPPCRRHRHGRAAG